jgi:hypothetical protein
MANTYKLISKNILSATTTTITLSSIPTTYTHLKLLISDRGSSTTLDASEVWLNGGTAASYVNGYIDANDGGSVRSGQAGYYQNITVPSNYGTNIFGFTEILIPNYTGSQEKNMASFFNTENTAINQYNGMSRTFTAVTSAISSLSLNIRNGAFVVGTSMHLYGLSNT